MNIYDKILSLCISTEELRHEFSTPCHRNGKVMATNGHVFVMMPENLPEGKYDGNDKFPKNAENLFTSALTECHLRGAGVTFGLAELESKLSKYEKEPVYETKPCTNKECVEGQIECDSYGYNGTCWTCWTCGGDGRIRTNKVVWNRFKYEAEIKIGKCFFKAYYAADVLGEIMRLTGSDANLVAQQEYNDGGELKHGSVFTIGDIDFMFMPVARRAEKSSY